MKTSFNGMTNCPEKVGFHLLYVSPMAGPRPTGLQEVNFNAKEKFSKGMSINGNEHRGKHSNRAPDVAEGNVKMG